VWVLLVGGEEGEGEEEAQGLGSEGRRRWVVSEGEVGGGGAGGLRGEGGGVYSSLE